MKQYVWIIAGGLMQVPMIEEVHRRSLGVILTDGNAACPALTSLNEDDSFRLADTYDEEKHIELALEMKKIFNIVGVVAPGADVGPTVSAIAETLGLPAASRRVATNVRNKLMMRLLCGFPYPKYLTVQAPRESVINNWERETANPYPCVVKAADNCASRGMSIVERSEDLLPAVNKALGSNKMATGAIIEQMLSGDEYSTDWLIIDGRALYMNGCYRPFRKYNKYTGERLYGVEAGMVNPINHPPEMTSIATIAARRLGVTEGWFKIDFIHDPMFGWCILECTTRCSGGWDVSHVAPLVGNNATSILLDYSIGLPLDRTKVNLHNGLYGVTYAPMYKEGKIDGWDGIDEALRSGATYVFPRSTTYIPKLVDSATRSIFIIVVGTNPRVAWTKAARAARLIKPRYT